MTSHARDVSRWILGLAMVTVWSIASIEAAPAADEEPPEPSRGGPVMTIPIDTESEAFAMVVGTAADLQAEVVAGNTLAIDIMFGGTNMDSEICVSLSTVGCIATLPVDADGAVRADVTVPAETNPGTHVVALESPTLGSVALGEIEVLATAPAAPGTTTATTGQVPATSAAPATTVAEDTRPPAAATDVALEPIEEPGLGLWFVLGAVAVVLLGWFGIRSLRRLRPAPQQHPHRLSNLELPTATQLPDRETARVSAVAVRTRRLEPGEGFIIVALAKDPDGVVVERETGRYEGLDDAMHAARDEARDAGAGVMWWEVRRHGSTLPVWIIEGDEAPVPSDGGTGPPES